MAVSFLRAVFLFPSRALSISASSQATRGLATLAQCARRCPRGASGWQRYRGSDGGAILSRRARLFLRRPCRGHAGNWGWKGGLEGGLRERPRDIFRSGGAFSGVRRVLLRMGQCVLPNCARSRSDQWSVWSSPRRRPVASAREKNARSQSSHWAKNFWSSASV
jgi:hypothetical protein